MSSDHENMHVQRQNTPQCRPLHPGLTPTTSCHRVFRTIVLTRSRVRESILAVILVKNTFLRIWSKFEPPHQSNQRSTIAGHLKTYHLISVDWVGGGGVCVEARQDMLCSSHKRNWTLRLQNSEAPCWEWAMASDFSGPAITNRICANAYYTESLIMNMWFVVRFGA